MKRLNRIILLILTLFLVLSCSDQTKIIDYKAVYNEVTFSEWGTLFDAFWYKMSTNYVFWSLEDEDGTWWDEIYEQYSPKFKSLGAIYDSDGNLKIHEKNEAQRFLFDITKNLHDSHYQLDMLMDSNTSISMGPRTYRYIGSVYDDEGKALNPTDNQIYAVVADEDKSSAIYTAFMKRQSEHAFNIAFYSLSDGADQKTDDGVNLFKEDSKSGISVNWEGTSKYSFNFESTEEEPFETVTTDGREMNFFSYSNTLGTVYGSLGYVDDGILYIGFNMFGFTSTGIGEVVAAKFHELAVSEETKAVIIDLRGNRGGAIPDLSLFWSVFLNDEPLTVGQTRRKAGTNRTDYGPWTDFGIPVNADAAKYDDFDEEKPIAVLTNNGSISCAEISTLTFAALRDVRGFNVSIIGEHGFGGFGNLNPYYSEIFYGTGVVNTIGQITQIYTPFLMLRYRDGVCYEGEGYPVDGDPMPFDYPEFVGDGQTKKDAKLDAALEWLKGEMK